MTSATFDSTRRSIRSRPADPSRTSDCTPVVHRKLPRTSCCLHRMIMENELRAYRCAALQSRYTGWVENRQQARLRVSRTHGRTMNDFALWSRLKLLCSASIDVNENNARDRDNWRHRNTAVHSYINMMCYLQLQVTRRNVLLVILFCSLVRPNNFLKLQIEAF
jgi:hypothetical protein